MFVIDIANERVADKFIHTFSLQNLMPKYRRKGRDEKSDLLGDREDHLIPSASQGESTVFFNKMKGDVTITAILKNSNQDSGDEGKEAVFSL
ncbi:hypothetical protein DY000_02044010 [Brassica cretica]|uniref:Uncharacterized protein n=1 Tax=Brassica cretica TaxID=69181 RepID=A0ABQ7B9W8_BRACR|nr:hypothetical protein DY000_02044010 [Brassica cretica]